MSRFQETRKSLVAEAARHHNREPNTKLIFPGNFLEKSKYPEIFVYDEFGYESDDDSYIFSDDYDSGSDWSEDEEDEEDTEKP